MGNALSIRGLAVIAMLVGGCASTMTPASTAPVRNAKAGPPPALPSDPPPCTGLLCPGSGNGTQLTGLTKGQTGAVHAIALPSGEVIPLR